MVRSFFFIILFLAAALFTGFLSSQYSTSPILFQVLIALSIFVLAFLKIEWGLYILIFSMLLSPEFMVSQAPGGAGLGRGVTLRLEDFLLIIIGFSWFARNAVYKELGLFLKTPLNKPIFFYLLVCILSTCLGIMAGRVAAGTGFFFVLKYFEYVIVFFMLVNYVENLKQMNRFLLCLLITCFVVSIIGMLQIPGGGRVSAPFEGEVGEPNTFGGYLVFMGAIAAGLFSKAESLKVKQLLAVLIMAIIPPFLFTQSRASYLAAIPVCLALGLMAEKRVLIVGLILISLAISPLFLPATVKNRIIFTFTQPKEAGQIAVAGVRVDTSLSARIVSWKEALQDWPKHPILGYGVTGYQFIDAQFPRILVETGIVGFMAFIYLLFSIFKLTILNLRKLKTPYLKGLVIGFLAGYIGLLFHAIGANTFIIVRIMEPFWFFVGIVTVLPTLEGAEQLSTEPVNGASVRFA
ncbi:MAG: O-antigen ligase family protein [Pseudomonadota bacterium]|nr:O-antigen ligase family protein [Pseudomonadota bacterium]